MTMANTVLSRNIEALKKRHSRLANEISRTRPSDRISILQSRSELTVPAVKTATGDKPLHSRVDPIREGRRMFDSTLKDECPGFVVALGVGGGYQMKPLIESDWVVSVVIVETDLRAFRSILEHVDLNWLFDDSRVSIFVEESLSTISGFIGGSYHPLIHDSYALYPLRSRMIHDDAWFSSCLHMLEETLERISWDMSTQSRFGRIWFRNTVYNLTSLPFSEQSLPEIRSAVVVAAGPSLEDTVSDLRSAKDRRTIIAVDTAAPALAVHGIVPDIVVTIDAQLVSYHHVFAPLPAQSLLVADLSASRVVAHRAGRRVFVSGGFPLGRYFAKEWESSWIPTIDTTGSNVTYAAVDLAIRLGATQIDLVGADFSYPRGKPYSRGSYIYPFFLSTSYRTQPVETLTTNLVFGSQNARVAASDGTVRYIPKKMERYREALESLLGRFEQSRLAVTDHIRNRLPIQPKQVEQTLIRYNETLTALPRPVDPLYGYIQKLSAEERAVLNTLFPTALHLHRRAHQTPAQVLEHSRRWAVDQVTASLDGFS